MKYFELQKYDKIGFFNERLIDISAELGIKAIIGKKILDQDGPAVIRSFNFDNDKMTEAKAQEWYNKNKDYSLESLLELYKDQDIQDRNSKKVTKFYKAKILHIDKENKIARVQVTGEDIDRDKEINLLSSWKKNKKTYMEHPVLVSSHKYDSLQHQIGEAVNMDWDKMIFDFKYYAGMGNPEADWAWLLAEKGMGMYSVGYLPIERMVGDAIPAKYRDKEPRCVYTQNELLETSQVVVGSYRGALQLGIDNPTIEHCQYAMEVVKSFNGDIPDFNAKATPAAPEPVIPKEPDKETPAEPKETPKINKDSIIISPVEIKNIEEFTEIASIIKEGRLITARNKQALTGAIEALKKAAETLQSLLELSNLKNSDKEVENKFNLDDYVVEGTTLVKKQK